MYIYIHFIHLVGSDVQIMIGYSIGIDKNVSHMEISFQLVIIVAKLLGWHD